MVSRSGSWFEDTPRGSRRAYISQNQIESKVHSPRAVLQPARRSGGDASGKMQALFPVFAILGVTTAAAAVGEQLTLLPYAYLADPRPVYRQSQDTKAGVHAYSYAGGPSAKEEVRGLDGVTRGSYSYLDAHGVLQSVFYVADEDGFRVAATNLPTDDDLPRETGEVLLARHAHLEKLAEAARVSEEEEQQQQQPASRGKRGAEEPAADRDRPKRPGSPRSPRDRETDRESADAAPTSSHERRPAPARKDEDQRGRAVAPVYGILASAVPLPRLSDVATSRVGDEAPPPATARPIEIPPAAAYEAVAVLPSRVPPATSHQSRIQAHDNGLRVEAAKLVENPLAVQPIQASEIAKYRLSETLPLVVARPAVIDYNENRIHLHRTLLGLEGPGRRDAVKIAALPHVATANQTPPPPLPVAVAASSVSSGQTGSEIQRDAKLDVALPLQIASGPTLYLASSYVQPVAHWPILAPVARSFRYRAQIHSSEKIETAK